MYGVQKMKESTNVAEIQPAKVVRKKSPETALKQEMAAINRDLVKLEKTLASFAEMKKEVDGAEAKKAELTERLAVVKTSLRTVLGLD